MGRDRGLAKTVDWWLVICWLLLVFIGWGNIYASIHASEPSSIFDFDFRSGKQFIWMITALFVIPPRLYEGLSLPIYLFMIGLLVAVIFLGIEVKGSRSWFAFGPVRFQPAEFSKISTSLLLATVMSQLGYRIGRFKDFIITALIILIPMMIIVLQSETGSALVYVGFIFMLYREGLSGWLIFMIGMAILTFILTLTASPFVAILVLAAVASLCICLYSDRFKWWLITCVPMIVFFAFLPSLLEWMTGLIVGAERLAEIAALQEAGEAVELPFIMKVKPIYILLGATLGSIPFLIYQAFREGGRFTYLTILSFLGGLLPLQ